MFGLIRRLSAESGQRIYADIEALCVPTRSFYAMVAVSTTIAVYGLLSNSTAVVIGAMLVAPLMGPIFGVALGLSCSDSKLLRNSLIAEAVGIVLAVGIAFVIGTLPLRADFGSEVLSRTQPTLYDIIIAVAAGLAGAYAMLNNRISPSLPGVAISTSLVPPLASCGLCLAAGRYDWATGAFLLFLANFLAIELASAGVFVVFGVHRSDTSAVVGFKDFISRFRVSIALLVVVGIAMTYTLTALIARQRLRHDIETALSSQLRVVLGARVSQMDVAESRNKINVEAVVLSPQQIEPALIAGIERVLQREVDERLHLVIRSIISSDADRNGPVYIVAEERSRRKELEGQTRFLATSRKIMTEQLSAIPGAHLVELHTEPSDSGSIISAVVRCSRTITPDDVKAIESELNRKLDSTVKLLVRCVLAHDVDSSGYIKTAKEQEEEITPQEAGFRLRIKQALINQLTQQEAASSLLNFDYKRNVNHVIVYATIRTPHVISPQQVAQMQEAFREHVHPGIELVIRSKVEADTAASGFISSRSPE